MSAVHSAFAALDARLRCAIEAAEQRRGYRFGDDPFAGLYLTRAQIERQLQPASVPIGSGIIESLDEIPEELSLLASAYKLAAFDLDILLLALAPDLDSKYERAFAFLNDDVARKRPTIEVALNLLCASSEEKVRRRPHFSLGAPVFANGLARLTDDGTTGLACRSIAIESRIAGYLMGDDNIDPQLSAIAHLEEPLDQPGPFPEHLDQIVEEARSQRRGVRIVLHGGRAAVRTDTARSLASALRARLLVVNVQRGVSELANVDTLFRLALREAWLANAIVLLEDADTIDDHAAKCLKQVLARQDGIILFSRSKAWFADVPGILNIAIVAPDWAIRRACWRSELARAGFSTRAALLDRLAGSFRLDHLQIRNAVSCARVAAHFKPHTGEQEEIFAAARGQSGDELEGLTQKVTPSHSFRDIVLPDTTMAQLREIAGRAEWRHRVLSEWGFDRKLSNGKGVTALFCGPSGTGKTMAAEILAHELRLDLYKIELAGVVSKYIGETEKNLDRIFAAAETANGVLLFDEADSLFGKRSEVKDAHDRYANLEISYLLQRMEQYQGIAILATNLRQNLDDAFLRRLAFSVQFPFPDVESRLRIWSGVWPKETPLAGDLDLGWIAEQFPLSGGNIRNIALGASFLAAEDRTAVSMAHLLRATRREFQKMGRTLSEDELAPCALAGELG